MQDPKVKAKLVKPGHPQSKETRLRIGIQIREAWKRRREKLLSQEKLKSEWQKIIAEASRKGYTDDREMQWDSYEILVKQMEEDWLKGKHQRMSKKQARRRAPKTLEHRRKISEAILAKWRDRDYRSRVCITLAQRIQRRKKRDAESLVVQTYMKNKAPNNEGSEENIGRKVNHCKIRRVNPSFKDPMADSKLEMLRKIREQREAKEMRKMVAVMRAKLVFEEAQAAAEDLEMTALKYPLAQASLIEMRNLLAEAKQYMRSVEDGKFITEDGSSKAIVYPSESTEISRSLPASQQTDLFGRRAVNSHCNSLTDSSQSEVALNEFGQQNRSAFDDTLLTEAAHNSSTVGRENGCIAAQPTHDCEMLNEENLEVCPDSVSTIGAGSKIEKKWVRGRFVEKQV